jgi:hypothetical protein
LNESWDEERRRSSKFSRAEIVGFSKASNAPRISNEGCSWMAGTNSVDL